MTIFDIVTRSYRLQTGKKAFGSKPKPISTQSNQPNCISHTIMISIAVARINSSQQPTEYGAPIESIDEIS